MGQPKESAEFVEWKGKRDRIIAKYASIGHYTETISINSPELSPKDARKIAEDLVSELDQLKVDEYQAIRRFELSEPQPPPYDLDEVIEGSIDLPKTNPTLAARPTGPQLPAAPGFWPTANLQSNARQDPQPPRLPQRS